MKIVINRCYGGFRLSDEAMTYFSELKNLNLVQVRDEKYSSLDIVDWYMNGEISDENYFSAREIARDDPDLIRVVEELGERASTRFSDLRIVEIPDDVDWYIEEYDGNEWVAETHRTWR